MPIAVLYNRMGVQEETIQIRHLQPCVRKVVQSDYTIFDRVVYRDKEYLDKPIHGVKVYMYHMTFKDPQGTEYNLYKEDPDLI